MTGGSLQAMAMMAGSGGLLVAQHYADLKDLIEIGFGITRDALHVHLGLAIFLVLARLLRGESRFRRALFGLLAIALLNEASDVLMALARDGEPDWPDGLRDLVNTLFWPAAWVLFGRRIVEAFASRRAGDGGPRDGRR